MTIAPALPISWIDTPEQLEALIETLRSEPRYGFDTEFHGEKTYFPSLALLQVSWSTGIALIDPLALDLKPFAEILRGGATALVHASTHDLTVIERACGVIPSSIFDTQLAAGFIGMSTPSLASLCDQLLGIRLSKGDRLTDWRRRPLTDDQIAYAAADVAHLFALHDQISDRLNKSGRLQWALDECGDLLTRDRSPQDPDTAWWRIKECRALKGQSRAIAQTVSAWREEWAISNDRPPRFIFGDLSIAVVASKPPTALADLQQIRGVDSSQLRGRIGEEILRAVKRGLELDVAEIRNPPVGETDRESRPGLALVSAWVGQIARAEKVDATLLATRHDLVSFLRGDEHAKLATGWRAQIVGDVLQRLMRGDVSVALDASGDLVLEQRSNLPA